MADGRSEIERRIEAARAALWSDGYGHPGDPWSVLGEAAEVIGELRRALVAIDDILTIPAAEYVPAIPDAWSHIKSALAKLEAKGDEKA